MNASIYVRCIYVDFGYDFNKKGERKNLKYWRVLYVTQNTIYPNSMRCKKVAVMKHIERLEWQWNQSTWCSKTHFSAATAAIECLNEQWIETKEWDWMCVNIVFLSSRATQKKGDNKQSRVIESNENASLQKDFAVFTLFCQSHVLCTLRAIHSKNVILYVHFLLLLSSSSWSSSSRHSFFLRHYCMFVLIAIIIVVVDVVFVVVPFFSYL